MVSVRSLYMFMDVEGLRTGNPTKSIELLGFQRVYKSNQRRAVNEL